LHLSVGAHRQRAAFFIGSEEKWQHYEDTDKEKRGKTGFHGWLPPTQQE
jgi:hypothetical protein